MNNANHPLPHSLIVPLKLSAVCVGHQDAIGDVDFVGSELHGLVSLPYMSNQGHFANEQEVYLGESLRQPPFNYDSERAKGVHIHWGLPDALRHGQIGKDTPYKGVDFGGLKFPYVPNRWLVIRLIIDQAKGTFVQKEWVVESDYLYPDEYQLKVGQPNDFTTIIPQLIDHKKNQYAPYRYLGRVLDYETWEEDPTAERFSDLTALGFGQPNFSTFYPHCKNVFGWHDALNDEQGLEYFNSNASQPQPYTLSYMVFGWYSDLTNDMLAGFFHNSTEQLQEDNLKEMIQMFRWKLNNYEKLPTQSFYSGAVTNVAWNPAQEAAYFTKQATTLQSVIAYNQTEAVSALVAQAATPYEPGNETTEMIRVEKVRKLEHLLNLFQEGWLDQLGTKSVREIEQERHKNSFEALQDTEYPPEIAPIPSFLRPGILFNLKALDNIKGHYLGQATGEALNDLNQKKRAFDRLSNQVQTLKEQIFCDWQLFIKTLYQEDQHWPKANDPNKKSSRMYADTIPNYWAPTQFEEKKRRLAQLETLKSELQAQYQALHIQATSQNLEIIEEVAPHYYQPMPPYIGLMGPEVKASDRFGQDGKYDAEDHRLFCRTTHEMITSITLAGNAADHLAEVRLSRKALAHMAKNEAFVHWNVCNALFQEFVLLDDSLAVLIANKLLGQMPTLGAPALEQYRGTIVNVVKGWQNQWRTHQKMSHTVLTEGALPSPFVVRKWTENPWEPTKIQWQLDYMSNTRLFEQNNGNYREDCLLENFALDQKYEIELVPKQPLERRDSESGYSAYTGETNLLLKPLNSLIHYLEAHKENTDEQDHNELENVLNKVKELNIAGQQLNEFVHKLLQLDKGFQLPVMDAGVKGGLFEQYTQQVAQEVGNHNSLAPQADKYAFQPLIHGELRVAKIHLIDAFGAVKALKTTPIVSEKMKDASLQNALYHARLLAPLRLRFQWRSVSNKLEENVHAASEAVLGWLMVNRLEGSLMIYDQAGNMRGSLTSNGTDVQIMGVPTKGPVKQSGKAGFEEVFGKANPYLIKFVQTLMADPGFLEQFMQAIDHGLVNSNPNTADNKGMALMVGRPLALVRNSLILESFGDNVAKKDPKSLADAVRTLRETNERSHRKDSGYAHVKIPVKMGALDDVNDGALGYFKENQAGQADFMKFYTIGSEVNSDRIVPSTDTSNWVDLGDHNTLNFMMVIDPRAAIHATTGLLPVTQLDLNQGYFEKIVNQLKIAFFTGPVLGSSEQLAFPQPGELNTAWEFMFQQGGEWRNNDRFAEEGTVFQDSSKQKILEGWLINRFKQK